MTALNEQIRRDVDLALKELPAEKMVEVLDFVLFLKKRCTENKLQDTTNAGSMALPLQTVPASHLDHLTGLVEWGGDALADSERRSIKTNTRPTKVSMR